jgi:D-threo-aldose 1-dehydrogenase
VREVELGGSGVRTSALGLGTAGFGARLTERARRRLLDAAFAAGIRHLDSAPLYGDGTAEASVGRFLRGKRDDVTVAAKVGLLPPPGGRLAPLARRVGARARRIGPGEARASLERTLRALHTDRVDVLLLHECRADDPRLDDWRGFLEDAVAAGLARTTGIATDPVETARLLGGDGAFPQVVQVAAHTVAVPPERGAVFHSVLTGRSTAADPAELLRAAVDSHPHAVALFSTRRPERIAANATRLGSPA